MNLMTSQQRKIAYLVAIAILLVPIIWLGMPSAGKSDPGGKLAQLRDEYDLGRADIGDIDPTSATMNLVLLGMRGVAANLMWMQLDEQKDHKNWAQMRATTDAIIKLQPHYMEVWRYNAWNLAYNVSAEWDGLEDRYFWVKEGAKFQMRGSQRNDMYPEMFFDTGRILGQKIGMSDEWRYFRKYFISDPDIERFDGGPDPAINSAGLDNYLAARKWYQDANTREESMDQHIMARALFRAYAYRCQIDYAGALHREGTFDEVARIAWEEAFREWTQGFGKETQYVEGGIEFFLEASVDDVKRFSKLTDADEPLIRKLIEREIKMTNYRYWRVLALSESQPETTAAHRDLYDGEQMFKSGEMTKAEKLLVSGLGKLEQVFEKHPQLKVEDLALESGLWSLMLWKKIYELNERTVPEEYTLKWLWVKEIQRVPELQSRFDREFGAG